MIELSASTTNSPPTSSSTSSFLVSTAIMPIAPPSDSDPTSPMNTCAGYALYQRKPMPVPNSAAQKIASSSTPWMCATCRYCAIVTSWPFAMSVVLTPAMYANTRNVPAFMIDGPIASPSSPSVKLTAFAVPTTTTVPNTVYSHAGSTNDDS